MLNQKEGHSKVEEDDFTLNTSSAEPLELDDHYTKQKSICWGRCHPMMFRKGSPAVVIGPHWPLFICAFLSFFIMGGLFIFLRIDEDPLIFYTTLIISINQCISYLIVALINPGVANIERSKNMVNYFVMGRYCKVCKLIQSKETQHCQDCDICIQEFDHHCPWTGKCIGKGNIKQFYYFIVSSIVFMIFNLVLVLLKIKEQDSRSHQQQ
ncbi:unnamed protein product (macronuclear) [Paramecium tetraurelia]|uniref:Palmitoyltransferase n=1 Tax=Paramecium tetraurelia TaxID=5888 RepID=A0BIT4_PARTE|nr:uncharacterized protein GSPATT00004823001 [Paramecium tetraurelia]CAK58451.1 unnamed protein product [Paramecium tetraurelia]|eukprot:XP_001425849.1 hypothetical protein (macronuclear) [Paramecium tetraurelia strain d4-2]